MKPVTRILTVAITVVLLKSPALRAASYTWDGGELVSSNWTAGKNWTGNIPPPSDGTADLIFTGIVGLNPNANLDWSIRSLTFGSGAGGFTIQGNPLTVGVGGITNGDDSVQTIENDIVLDVSQTFRTTGTGSFAINGSVNTNGNALTVDAATDFIVLGGAITGGGALKSVGINSLVLTGGANNTYAGGTTVSGNLTLAKTGGATAIPGALVIGGGAGLNNVAVGFDEQIANTSAVTVSAGASLGLGMGVVETVGALTIGNGAVRIDTGSLKASGVTMTGGTISSRLAGRLILAGNITATAGGLQTSSISGRIDLGGATRTFTVGGAAGSVELDINAAISNGSVIKAGAGTLRLSGAQTYASLLAQAGTVDLESAVGTGTSSVTVTPTAGSATVNFNASQRLASLTIGNGGVVNVNAQDPGSGDPYETLLHQGDDLAQIAKSDGSVGNGLAVPEPGSLSLMLMGASGSLVLRRRKRA